MMQHIFVNNVKKQLNAIQLVEKQNFVQFVEAEKLKRLTKINKKGDLECLKALMKNKRNWMN